MAEIDFGRHAEDYASYRPGLPASFYRRLETLIPLRGSRALDLATGPGTIALELGARGSTVIGIDVAAGQVETAERVSRQRGLQHRVSFQVARAEATALEPGSFDLVTAGQCWHWFDGPVVLKELLRVLRPGGFLVIANNSYLARHSPVAHDTEELILEFNPTWNMAGWSGSFPEQIDEVIQGGFQLVEQFCYDYPEEFSHLRWRGRMRTCNGVGSGGLSPQDVLRFDEALAALLLRKYPDPLFVPHRVWSVVGRKGEA